MFFDSDSIEISDFKSRFFLLESCLKQVIEIQVNEE